MGLPGVLRGVLKRVKGAVAPGVVAADVAVDTWGFLAYVFQHGTEKGEVIVTVKSAI